MSSVAKKTAAEKPVVLVDIDGTLADVRHRLHHILGGERKNWKAFFEGMDRDTPIPSTIAWVRSLVPHHEIVILTGRPEQYRRRTIAWLKKQQVPFDGLVMRTNGDHRPDFEMKRDVLDHVAKNRIKLVIEDRPPVCDMWLKEGVRCVLVDSHESNQMVNEIYRQVGGKASARKKNAK